MWHHDKKKDFWKSGWVTVLGESPVNEFNWFGSAELAKHDFKWEEDREHATIRLANKASVFLQPGLRDTTFFKTKCVVLHVFSNIVGWNSLVGQTNDG